MNRSQLPRCSYSYLLETGSCTEPAAYLTNKFQPICRRHKISIEQPLWGTVGARGPSPKLAELTGPQRKMLRSFLEWERLSDEHRVPKPTYWPTDGMGGARVSKALQRRGLVEVGVRRDGYMGARLTSDGRRSALRLAPRKSEAT